MMRKGFVEWAESSRPAFLESILMVGHETRPTLPLANQEREEWNHAS